MQTHDFQYDLPERLIAQAPRPRGEARMLVLPRLEGAPTLDAIASLPDYLRPGDTLVVNNSRVTARRLRATRADGRDAEVLLLRPERESAWSALVRPGRRIRTGDILSVRVRGDASVQLKVGEATPEGGRVLWAGNPEERDALAVEGTAPLPPYIHAHLDDEARYQTVYARAGGSAAAPTAGLHFTEAALDAVRAAGAQVVEVTLHVGIDTFRPVRAADAETHVMHGEEYSLSPHAAAAVNGTRGRVIAIGTTSVRVLEAAANGEGRVVPGSGVTRLFIRPGFEFRVVGGLLTNFHLPCSTLLMLVSAFAGRERVLDAYAAAVDAGFQFYSFGDAMLIV